MVKPRARIGRALPLHGVLAVPDVEFAHAPQVLFVTSHASRLLYIAIRPRRRLTTACRSRKTNTKLRAAQHRLSDVRLSADSLKHQPNHG